MVAADWLVISKVRVADSPTFISEKSTIDEERDTAGPARDAETMVRKSHGSLRGKGSGFTAKGFRAAHNKTKTTKMVLDVSGVQRLILTLLELGIGHLAYLLSLSLVSRAVEGKNYVRKSH